MKYASVFKHITDYPCGHVVTLLVITLEQAIFLSCKVLIILQLFALKAKTTITATHFCIFLFILQIIPPEEILLSIMQDDGSDTEEDTSPVCIVTGIGKISKYLYV